jgi:hypothetical protein
MRVPGAQRFNLRIAEGGLVNVLAGADRRLAAHDLRDEFLLRLDRLPEVAVE